jgi:hypothetical protein
MIVTALAIFVALINLQSRRLYVSALQYLQAEKLKEE